MARDNFSIKVKRGLNQLSNGCCMICRRYISTPNYAHIIPASKQGPRSNERGEYSQEFIISIDNGLCLCPECHMFIDDPSTNKYTTQELFEINKRFQDEFNLKEEYKQQLGIYNDITDKEIKNIYTRIYDYLNDDDDIQIKEDYDKISYTDKMNLNQFSKYYQKEIKFFYSVEFSAFEKAIQEMPIAAVKLRAAISTLYMRLSMEEKNNNKIIEKMLNIMSDPSEEQLGNKLTLYYFFIICEVFKK